MEAEKCLPLVYDDPSAPNKYYSWLQGLAGAVKRATLGLVKRCMRMIELLAPAGSEEALRAAVESGADAVYLGGTGFGARAFAQNFEGKAMEGAIRYAHLRGVRVHVTVNTLVQEREIPDLARYLRFLYEAGADAVLVQDLGVYRVAREVVPRLPLHASTQMTVNSSQGVLALAELGFERVVLARELSLDEIEAVCQASPVEIEVFAHGALCVCYSGQCLMSSMIGGRSGNRGRCAQPCRLPYTLSEGKEHNPVADLGGEYLLSPKDLSTVEMLPELIKTGVSSLKIEGRMKRPEYVATVVRVYRKAIDRCLEGNFFVEEKEKESLAQIFNRDFSVAYLKGYPGKEMMSISRPNNRGLFAGRVTAYDGEKKFVTVKLATDLFLGDQMDFWVKVGGRVNLAVTEIYREGKRVDRAEKGEEVSFFLEKPGKKNDRVFKIYDAKLMEEAKKAYTGKFLRKIGVNMKVRAKVGEEMELEISDADGYKAEAKTKVKGEIAEKRPLTYELLQEQMSRLGDTPFVLTEISAEIEEGVIFPIREINALRREAVSLLEEERLLPWRERRLPSEQGEKPPVKVQKYSRQSEKSGEKTILTVSVDTLDKVRGALKAGADAVVFGGDSYQHEILPPAKYEEAARLILGAGKNFYAQMPRVLPMEYENYWEKLLEGFDAFPKNLRPEAVYVHNIGEAHMVKRLTHLEIALDFSPGVMNSLAIKSWRDLGAKIITLSPELTFEQVAALNTERILPLECMVHGPIELMVSKYCPVGSFLAHRGKDRKCNLLCQEKPYFLKDRKGVFFPLRMDGFCQTHILNSRPLSMLPYVENFAQVGVFRLRIEGKYYEAKELAAIVGAYRKAIDENKGEDLAKAAQEFTRGHYFRGVD